MLERYLPGGQDAGDTGILYDDGEYIFFVNAAVDDGSRIAKLMNYFKTADPDDDSEGELSKRVRYLKKEEGGMNIADIAEDLEETDERIREIAAEVTAEQKE